MGEYGEMQKMLSGLTAAQYLQQVRLENLTLLHHVAFSGNIEALNVMSELPYFKEILDESENEVGFRSSKDCSKDGRHLCGLPQRST